MYAKCGALIKAHQVLDELPVRDVVSWSVLISGYAQHGHGEEALNCFKLMQREGISPDAVTFACILKGCGSIGETEMGEKIHAEIVRKGLLEKDVVLGNALVDMYAKCGALEKAQKVLEELPFRDVISWSTLIAGYAQHGHAEEALVCFGKMQSEGLSPNAVTFTSILKACGSLRASDKGEKIHAEIVRQGLLEKDRVLGIALVDMYVKCGALSRAQQVLDELPLRDVASWSALIAGYAQQGHFEEVLSCFDRMKCEGCSLNMVIFACVLKACTNIRAVDKGEEIHAEILRKGLLGTNIVLGNALINMYAKCGALAKAARVLDELTVRDVVSWSTLIAGYSYHDQGEEALNCYENMQREGISPNVVTFICILKACGSVGAVEKGESIHAEIAEQGLLGKDSVLDTAVVDMYAKCGAFAKAQQVLDKLPVQNVASWNALIAGYAQHGHAEEALKCMEQMQSEGLFPDVVTFACSLKACGSIGAANRGEKIHAEIVKQGLLIEGVLGNAIVDMYVKCGALAKAQELLDELPVRDIISWSALIAGYAQHGHGEEALHCFDRMQSEGLSPNAITFGSVLNACSHSGLLDEGQILFERMKTEYGIIPESEHYMCMVDLWGRAGHLDKAVAMIKNMPSSDRLPLWVALMGACQKWGDVKLGRLAFEHMIQLSESCDSAYICMSNIYRVSGMQEDADKMEIWREKNNLKLVD